MNIKTTLTTLFFLLFTTISIQSQTAQNQSSNEFTEIFRFNGITYSGDRIFGIHPNKEKAIQIATGLMFQDNNSEDRLKELKISIETIEKKKGALVYEQFKKLCPNGYKAISKEEFSKLTKLEKEGLLGNSPLLIEKN
ncbi:hypothetical protein [Aquimarina algiphila]|uniref:Uncharacterized protein n=1 Tax=Aquimarina algiphila TaxID=2047982 RepID=A0A554VJ16_9FLAO|nr:hypothetical protein [Aquimarina algiphila]TSE07883.1 hypothetical protein FOF46_14245 [Aquimarina algiphila]